MEITFKMTIDDYRKFLIKASYSRVITWIMAGMGFFIFLNSFISMISNLTSDAPTQSSKGIVVSGLIGCIFMFYPVIISYINAGKLYNSNKSLNEEMTYAFNEEGFIIKGESFKSEMKWEKLWKIKEMKDFLLLYQGKMIANIIPKKYVDEHVLNSLKLMLKEKEGMEKILKLKD